MGKEQKYYCDVKGCGKETEANSNVMVASEGLMREYGNKRFYLCSKHAGEFIIKYQIPNLNTNYNE